MRLVSGPDRIDRPASRLSDSVEPATPAKVDHPESRGTAESQDKLLSAMRYEFGGHMQKRAGN
jgi:6-phosphogluconate dehydrogenase (decarboxylating)